MLVQEQHCAIYLFFFFVSVGKQLKKTGSLIIELVLSHSSTLVSSNIGSFLWWLTVEQASRFLMKGIRWGKQVILCLLFPWSSNKLYVNCKKEQVFVAYWPINSISKQTVLSKRYILIDVVKLKKGFDWHAELTEKPFNQKVSSKESPGEKILLCVLLPCKTNLSDYSYNLTHKPHQHDINNTWATAMTGVGDDWQPVGPVKHPKATWLPPPSVHGLSPLLRDCQAHSLCHPNQM